MSQDEAPWWPSDAPPAARLLRYQLQVLEGAALLQTEVTLPGDVERTSDETQHVAVAMLASQCRRLGQHLLQCADLLERHQKPLQ